MRTFFNRAFCKTLQQEKPPFWPLLTPHLLACPSPSFVKQATVGEVGKALLCLSRWAQNYRFFSVVEFCKRLCFILACVSPLFKVQSSQQNFEEVKGAMVSYLRNTDCSSEKIIFLMNHIYKTRPKKCVEIGVYTGSSLLPVAAVLKYHDYGIIYAVDSWSNKEAIRHMNPKDTSMSFWSNVEMDRVYDKFKERLYEWDVRKQCVIVKTASENVASKLKEIDFLHLDGNHTESGALADVALYFPQVKRGGYILFSHLFYKVRGFQPKLKSFRYLLKHCDVVGSVDHYNTVLLRKR